MIVPTRKELLTFLFQRVRGVLAIVLIGSIALWSAIQIISTAEKVDNGLVDVWTIEHVEQAALSY